MNIYSKKIISLQFEKCVFPGFIPIIDHILIAEEQDVHKLYTEEYGAQNHENPPLKYQPRRHRSPNGDVFFIKHMGAVDLLSSINTKLVSQRVVLEKIAYDLYALFGVSVPKSHIVLSGDGASQRYGIASEEVEGVSLNDFLGSDEFSREAVLSSQEKEGKPIKGLFDKLPIFTLLFDYDAIGSTMENIRIVDKGEYWQAVKIDPGAASLLNLPDGNPISHLGLNRGINTLRDFLGYNELQKFDLIFNHVSDDDITTQMTTLLTALDYTKLRDTIFTELVSNELFPQHVRSAIYLSIMDRIQFFRDYLDVTENPIPSTEKARPLFTQERSLPFQDVYKEVTDLSYWGNTSKREGSFSYVCKSSDDGMIIAGKTEGCTSDWFHMLNQKNYLHFIKVGLPEALGVCFDKRDRYAEGIKNKGAGWKLHISLDRDLDNISKAISSILPFLCETTDQFKLINPLGLEFQESLYFGREMTVYLDRSEHSEEEWAAIFKNLETLLTDAGIYPGIQARWDQPLLGGTYLSLRNDRSVTGRYVDMYNLVGFRGAEAADLTLEPNPFEKLFSKITESEPLITTTESGISFDTKIVPKDAPLEEASCLNNLSSSISYNIGELLDGFHGGNLLELSYILGSYKKAHLYLPINGFSEFKSLKRLKSFFSSKLSYYFEQLVLQLIEKGRLTDMPDPFDLIKTFPSFVHTMLAIYKQVLEKYPLDLSKGISTARTEDTLRSRYLEEELLNWVDRKKLLSEMFENLLRDPKSDVDYLFGLTKPDVMDLCQKISRDVERRFPKAFPETTSTMKL